MLTIGASFWMRSLLSLRHSLERLHLYNKKRDDQIARGTLLQLATSSLYPDVAYDGIPQVIMPEMKMTADCSLSPSRGYFRFNAGNFQQ